MIDTNSRCSSVAWRPALFGAALVCLLGIAPSVAQAPSPQPSAPVSLVPAAPEASTGGAPSPTIEVGTLEELGLDRIGLADIVSDALPGSMWTGSDPELVKAALARMPHRIDSVALRMMALRLLLPAAATPLPPGDVVDAAVAPSDDPWLFRARVSALAGFGDWTDAARMIDMAPPDKIDGALRKLRVDAMLVTGKLDAACTEAQVQLAAGGDPHWQKIHVLCQFQMKQATAAQLGLSLLQEQAIDDPAFFWAAELLQGNRPLTPNGLKRLEPTVLAMLAMARRPVPDSVLREGDPTALRIAALMDPPAPTDDEKLTESERADRVRLMQGARLIVAERALAAGSLAPADLAQLYLAVDFSTDLKPPQLTQVTADDARGRAFMFQLAKAQTVPTARAEVIARAFDLARADRGAKGPPLSAVALAYADLVAELPPSTDLIWFAGHAVRLLTAAGQAAASGPWIDLLMQMARTNIEAAEIADSLWPILRLGSSEPAASAQDLRIWQATRPATEAVGSRETLLNLLEAVGDPVTAADWLPILVSGSRPIEAAHPPVAIWSGAAEAARAGRVGDTVALSLIAAGDGGLDRVSPLTVARVVQTLIAVGRPGDARAIAVEAALMAGL